MENVQVKNVQENVKSADDLSVAATFACLDLVQEQTTIKSEKIACEKSLNTEEREEGEIDSEPDLSSSEGSEDGKIVESEESGEEDEESDDEEIEQNSIAIEKQLQHDEKKISSVGLKTENEVSEEKVREVNVELTADCPIAEFGSVLNVNTLEKLVTVRSYENQRPLDEGSVLCLSNRVVLGCVDEVFGPVTSPMYLIRFGKDKPIPEGVSLEERVFYATEHTTYVIPEQIRNKGTDASNKFDEEVDDNEAEYSDDEKETEAKRKKKAKRKRLQGDKHANSKPLNNHQQRNLNYNQHNSAHSWHKNPQQSWQGNRQQNGMPQPLNTPNVPPQYNPSYFPNPYNNNMRAQHTSNFPHPPMQAPPMPPLPGSTQWQPPLPPMPPGSIPSMSAAYPQPSYPQPNMYHQQQFNQYGQQFGNSQENARAPGTFDNRRGRGRGNRGRGNRGRGRGRGGERNPQKDA